MSHNPPYNHHHHQLLRLRPFQIPSSLSRLLNTLTGSPGPLEKPSIEIKHNGWTVVVLWSSYMRLYVPEMWTGINECIPQGPLELGCRNIQRSGGVVVHRKEIPSHHRHSSWTLWHSYNNLLFLNRIDKFHRKSTQITIIRSEQRAANHLINCGEERPAQVAPKHNQVATGEGGQRSN